MLNVRPARWFASAALLSLVALLAACGQSSTPTANGVGATLRAVTTPSAASTASVAAPIPTDIPLPYSLPKKWLPAPDGADQAQWPETVGGFVFSPSSPQTGYFCIASPDHADDTPSTLPSVSGTVDGGQTWSINSGSTSRFKTACRMFIDQSDPKDVFVTAGNPQTGEQFYRSRDGGMSWHIITIPNLNLGTPVYVSAVAVVRSRLIVALGLSGEGSLPYPLYASDDGGVTWNPISLIVNGTNAELGQQLWIAGNTLIAAAGGSCQGPCGTLQAPPNRQRGTQPLSQPFSSQPLPPIMYFRSTDGGHSWTQLILPSSTGSIQSIQDVELSSDGSHVYVIDVITLAQISQGLPAGTRIAFYSTDAGASWRQLPTLIGVENGYPSPTSLGNDGIFVLPNGWVVASTFHVVGTTYMGEAGAFLLRPTDAAPTWQPLVNLTKVSILQAIANSGGVRFWGIAPAVMGTGNGFLVYFDLP